MRRKFLILICLILFIVSVAGVSASEDANQTVDETLSVSAIDNADQTNDTLGVFENVDELSAKDDGTFTALQKKIDNAYYGSTITLENDYKYDEGFTSDGIKISSDKKLTIDGNGYAIDGNNMARIFNISGNVVLKNIVIQNGKSNNNGDGGAINVEAESIISCIHCTFINNTADDDGGAINVKAESIISCIHCNFINNTADGGGAISVVHRSNISISDCTFINNGVPNLANDAGGAIYIFYANCRITNSIFEDNYAVRGGAIYAAGDDASIVVDTSEFTNNLAYNYGGAIFWNCRGNITNSKFTKNTAVNHHADAIYLSINHNKILNNCDFINKYRVDDSIYFPRTYVSTELTLSNLNFKNDLNDYGGLISVKDNILTFGGVGDVVPSKNVVVSIGGKTYEDSLEPKGIVEIDLSGLPGGVYDARISYDNYLNINLPITIESSTVLDVPDVTKDYGGPERLEITLTESGSPIASADVNININGADYTRTTDANGKASLGLNLNAGNYDAVVTYNDISTTAKVVINKLATKNTLSYTKNSHNSVTLSALIDPSTASGDVVFTVKGKDYSAKVNGGKATYTLNNLAVGSYSAVAKYKGDVNHKESSSNSVKFTVEDVNVDVSAPDLTKYYHGPERFVVTVKEDNKPVVGKNVTINLNGVPYKRLTDANGQASMAINLNSGVHTAVSEFEGIKVQSTITVKPTVSGNNVTKIYRNDTQYYATFLDTGGNLLKNTDVNFNINGVFYTRTTDNQGVAKMNINLLPGEYVITAINPVSTEQSGNLIKVLPSVVTYDLTKYYKNASKLTFKLLDSKGNPVGAGVSATININGVLYTRQSDASGYVSMNINLNPGTYIATINYNGLMASSTVKVLPILEANDISMKYRDGTKFEAKLLDGQGKPNANQTVTFNINGVMYNRITDDGGIARLAINLMPGEYIITSMYENGATISNRVTIRS